MHGPEADSRRNAMLFGIVTAVALLIRAAHILAMSRAAINPMFLRPITDAGVHHRWAQGLLDGSWPPAEAFFRAPLYPYLLGGLYAIFGADNRLPVQLVHGLISAFGAGLVGLCAARLWNRRAGWIAGLLMAALWPSIYYSAELLGVTLSVTLNLLLLWLLLGGTGRRRLLLAGVVLGLSAITRPTILVVVPALLWYLHRWRRVRWRDGRWLLLAAGLALPILPVTAHNLVRGRDAVLINASGGVNFYIGNNEHARGRVAFLPGLSFTWKGDGADVVELAQRESGRQLNASGADRYFLGKGLSFIASHPGRALKLLGRKAWLLLAAGERSNNKNLVFWCDRSPVLRWPVWLGWAPLLALAVVGLARRDLDPAARRLMLGFLVLYGAALLLFFINARFRLPLLAWLVVPAAGGVDLLIGDLRRKRWPRPRAATAAAVLVLLVSVVPDAITSVEDLDTEFESWGSLGHAYAEVGDPLRARRALTTALAVDRGRPQKHHERLLPVVYGKLVELARGAGVHSDVERLCREWTGRLPRDLDGHCVFGEHLTQTSRHDESVASFDRALEIDATSTRARIGRGFALLGAGRHDEALGGFRVLRQERVRHPQVDFGIGLCLMQLNRPAEAESAFRAVVEREPRYWQAWGNLAAIYESTGQVAQEKEALQRLVRLNPRDERARQRLDSLP